MLRWWRYVLVGALLAWVLGTAYYQARRRGRHIGAAVLLVGGAVAAFGTAALVPRPPMPEAAAAGLAVAAIALLGLAMGVVLWRGFRT